jgi:hypothetical protein
MQLWLQPRQTGLRPLEIRQHLPLLGSSFWTEEKQLFSQLAMMQPRDLGGLDEVSHSYKFVKVVVSYR